MNFTKQDIEKLSRENSIVRACCDAQRYNQGISWEQALTAMVVHLAENNAAIMAMYIKDSNSRPMPPVFFNHEDIKWPVS